MKPVWTWTHTGEQGEELCCLENKYYTRFAWDHFLAAYTGKVRPAHRDRPGPWMTKDDPDFDFKVTIPWSSTLPGYNGVITIPDWPDDEKTDPMPQTVISPRQLTPAQKLKSKP